MYVKEWLFLFKKPFFCPKEFFFDQSEGATAYSKLAQKFKDAGGDEQIYEEWRNPDYSSSWHLPMPNPRDSPIAVPDASLPEHICRDSAPSVVSDVDFDSRFYGLSNLGDLIPQSQKTMIHYGHIDRARHRDYRVLSVDYYIANLDEQQTQIVGRRSGAVSSSSRGRRRQRKPREPMSPAQRRQETRSSKASNFSRWE